MTRSRLLLAALGAALALSACGGGQEEPAEAPGSVAASGTGDAQSASITGNAQLQFVPAEITMQPGTLELTLENEGGVPHDLEFTGDGAQAGEPLPLSSETQTGSFTFPEPGTYDFVCTVHPGMEGRVVVG